MAMRLSQCDWGKRNVEGKDQDQLTLMKLECSLGKGGPALKQQRERNSAVQDLGREGKSHTAKTEGIPEKINQRQRVDM